MCQPAATAAVDKVDRIFLLKHRKRVSWMVCACIEFANIIVIIHTQSYSEISFRHRSHVC